LHPFRERPEHLPTKADTGSVAKGSSLNDEVMGMTEGDESIDTRFSHYNPLTRVTQKLYVCSPFALEESTTFEGQGKGNHKGDFELNRA
jgi:hypothetical protein